MTEPTENDPFEELIAVRLEDHLQEATKRYRKSLLGISVICWAIYLTGTLPTRINTLGMIFESDTSKQNIVWGLIAVCIYYLAEFLFHAWRDYERLLNRLRQPNTKLEAARLVEEEQGGPPSDYPIPTGDRYDELYAELWHLKQVPENSLCRSLRVHQIGVALTYAVPALFGASAIIALLNLDISVAVNQ